MTNNASNFGVVFPQANQVAVQDLPIPALSGGHLLIKTRRSLISSGTELTMLGGEFESGGIWARDTKFPCQPGYANIGLVLDVGEGVDKSWIGRRVASYSPHAAVTAAWVGVCWPVPDGIDDESAAFFVIAQITMNALRRAQVSWGDSVVIFGMGLLGQLAARFCMLAGARPVFVADVAPRRLDLAGEGFIKINPAAEDPLAAVQKHNAGRLADVVFEVTGNAGLIASELKVLRPVGRMVMLSSPKKPVMFDFHDQCNHPSFSIIGAHNWSHPETETCLYPWTKGRHAELFFNYIADGRLDLKPLITHRAPVRDAVAQYDMLRNDRGSAMGVILQWD